jgi:hypothetical protein
MRPVTRSLIAFALALSPWSAACAEAGQADAASPAQAQIGQEQIVVEARREGRSNWKRAESEHVLMFSDGGEAELKRAATDVERLHQLMVRLYGPDAQTGETAKLKIILIDSVPTYRDMALRNLRAEEGPYVPPFAGQRYYDPREDGAVLVLPRADQVIDLDTSKARDAFCDEMGPDLLLAQKTCAEVANRPAPAARPWDAILFSAYAQHFVLNYLPAGYPRWYLDGIGALFSTVRMRRNGALDYANVSLANRQVFRSYGRLNAADVLTGRYLDAPSGQMEWTPFHAALLVHFFVYSDLTPERRTQFRRYMTAVHQGVPMAKAAGVFGDMRKLRREISGYADRDGLTYARTEPSGAPVQEPSITTLSLANAAMLEASLGLPSRGAAGAPGHDIEAALLLAESECRRHRYQACLAAADSVLERSPDDAQALGWKGVALTDAALAGDAGARPDGLRRARAAIERAIARDGDAPLPLIAYFESYAKAGERVPEQGMAAMAKAIRLVPAAPASRLALGAELVRQGQPDLARKLLYPVLFGPYDSPERKAAEAMFATPDASSTPG